MTNEKLFYLTQELLERMEIAKKEAADLDKKFVESDLSFVHIEDKEYVNPKLLPFVDHFKIVQLCKFLCFHNEIKEDDLLKILRMNKLRFQTLIKLKNVIPNLIDEARKHKDEKYISYLYVGLNQNNKKEKGLNI